MMKIINVKAVVKISI